MMSVRTLSIITLAILGILLVGCSQDPDNPVNTVVRGYVYTDSTFTVPVESVYVIVRVDDASQVPDYTTYTNEDGFYEVSFYLGHNYTCEYEYYYYAKVNVIYMYKGKSYMSPDYYLEMGEEYNLPPIHLGQFSSP